MSNGVNPTLAAILPLVGVALGALLGGLGNYVIKRRDERREIRAVVRLLHEELVGHHIDIAEKALSRMSPDALSGWKLDNPVWDANRLIIARHFNGPDLRTLRETHVSINFLLRLAANMRSSPDVLLRFARKAMEALEKAVVVCHHYADGLPPLVVSAQETFEAINAPQRAESPQTGGAVDETPPPETGDVSRDPGQ